jgi:pyrimidine operon attenuation protein/uracil phosphoribosyltransferase
MTSRIPESPSVAVAETLVADATDIDHIIHRLAHHVLEVAPKPFDWVVLGVVTRGRYLAERLASTLSQLLGKPVPVGFLDITLYRDDSSQSFKPTGASHLPVDVTDRTVLLVDDVLNSGRTVRAALDALHAYGRPQRIKLLALLDRGDRELPIHADFVGKTIQATAGQRVNVRLAEVDGVDQVTLG